METMNAPKIEAGPGRLVYDKAKKSIVALRTPDASLARCPNTVRQSIADVIEAQQRQLDKYGLALMMIREGVAEPSKLAAETLEKCSRKQALDEAAMSKSQP